MKRTLLLLTVCAALLMSLGCVGVGFAPVIPPPAFVVTMHSAPVSTNFAQSPVGTRKGTATVTNILGLVSLGDCSINAAARDGNLKTISYADYTVTNVMWIFATTTVTVYGD